MDTYSFLSDEEPSDEQLEQLMKEMMEDVLLRRAQGEIRFQEMMRLAREESKANFKKFSDAAEQT